MNPNLTYLLALTYVPGLGPINQRKILQKMDAKSIWELSQNEIKTIFRGKKQFIPHFSNSTYIDLAEKQIDYCHKNNIEILDFEHPYYPEKLKLCPDAPLVLFQKGKYQFNRKLHIAVVGTRKMTNYGKNFIEKFMDELSHQPIAIVSGLAYGCDIQAHRNSLAKDISNVAVLAHGFQKISPSSHQKDSEEIIKNGCLLTEYSTFHVPEPMNFVLRNRIIAGISDAVVVVESDSKGGALATASYAQSYNREVFALPGRVDDKYSLGCNGLIHSLQASILRNAEDLMNYFQLNSASKPVQKELFIDLEVDEEKIFNFLRENGKQQIDSISNQTKIPIFTLNSLLLNLELKGIIKPYSGKFYGLI